MLQDRIYHGFTRRVVSLLATGTMNAVKIGCSNAEDPTQVAAELAEQIGQPESELVLFFSSARYEPDALARAMDHRFPGITAGCTTAGEIGPAGYQRFSTVAVSLGKGPIRVHRYPLESVSTLDPGTIAEHRRQFDRTRAYPGASLSDDCLGLLLVDGLSLRDEQVVAAWYGQFQPMPIVGGSAGDDFAFRETRIFTEGRAISNGSVFLVLEMGGVPFQTFHLQDFAPVSDHLVITAADSERRMVQEIDGEPAQDVYARMVGVPIEQMTPEHFASHSFLVQVGGQEYIRSVRSVGPERSLILHSAIDEGVVIRLGRSDDTLVSLAQFLRVGSERVAQTSLALCFDCIHRQLELIRQGYLERAGKILTQVPSVGFSTYGEVADSLHVNQTMTGVLFNYRDRSKEPC